MILVSWPVYIWLSIKIKSTSTLRQLYKTILTNLVKK